MEEGIKGSWWSIYSDSLCKIGKSTRWLFPHKTTKSTQFMKALRNTLRRALALLRISVVSHLYRSWQKGGDITAKLGPQITMGLKEHWNYESQIVTPDWVNENIKI